jgi:hypothetical protein
VYGLWILALNIPLDIGCGWCRITLTTVGAFRALSSHPTRQIMWINVADADSNTTTLQPSAKRFDRLAKTDDCSIVLESICLAH